MRIKCPVNSLSVAKTQIRLGADEIYLGLSSDDFSNLTYGGRGKYTWNGKNSCIKSKEELKEIVDYAHEHNTKVHSQKHLVLPFSEWHLS